MVAKFNTSITQRRLNTGGASSSTRKSCRRTMNGGHGSSTVVPHHKTDMMPEGAGPFCSTAYSRKSRPTPNRSLSTLRSYSAQRISVAVLLRSHFSAAALSRKPAGPTSSMKVTNGTEVVLPEICMRLTSAIGGVGLDVVAGASSRLASALLTTASSACRVAGDSFLASVEGASPGSVSLGTLAGVGGSAALGALAALFTLAAGGRFGLIKPMLKMKTSISFSVHVSLSAGNWRLPGATSGYFFSMVATRGGTLSMVCCCYSGSLYCHGFY
mmetsp:Transcript_10821/g.24761  ORF Transcript_10821/g.24761 Transcript_10821/m.24761 type:complete len:271 (-) Transcript_10821:27-839(-)